MYWAAGRAGMLEKVMPVTWGAMATSASSSSFMDWGRPAFSLAMHLRIRASRSLGMPSASLEGSGGAVNRCLLTSSM